MISSILLTASTVPATPVWNPTVGAIISASCVLAVLLALKVKQPLVGPRMPGLPLSIPAFVGAMAFGHILGVGIVLGLTNIGTL